MDFTLEKIIVIQFKTEQKTKNPYIENLPEKQSFRILKPLEKDHA